MPASPATIDARARDHAVHVWSAWSVAAFLAMGVLYFCAFYHRIAVPGTVFNEIQSDLGLSAAAVTGLSAIYLYIYAALQPFVGILADRFGGGRLLLGGGAVMTLGALLFPLSESLWALNLSRALVGLGASTIFLCYIKETEALFGPRRLAYILGPLLFMGLVGGLAGTWPTERAVAAFGWRQALLGVAVLSGLGVVAAAFLLRRVRDQSSRGAAFAWRQVGELMTNRAYLCAIGGNSLAFSAYLIIQSTLGKKFIEDFTGMAPQSAAGFTFIMMNVSMALTFVAGFVPRFLGHRRLPVIFANRLAVVIACVLLLAGVKLGAPPALFLVSFILLAASNGVAPVSIAWLNEVVRPGSVALAVGLANCCVYFAVALVTHLAGLLMDRHQAFVQITERGAIYPTQAYADVFLMLLIVALIAGALTLFLPETRGASIWRDPGEA